MSKVIKGWRFSVARGSRLSARLRNPTGLAAQVSGSSVILTWVDASDKTAQTIVYQSADNGATWSTVTTKSTGVLTHTITGLADGSYKFAVAATSSAGTKDKTSSVSAIIATAFVPDVVLTFEGTNGAAVGNIAVNTYGNFRTSYAGGYGSKYSNAQTRAGRATSMEMSIPSGSDGDPGGGSTGTGKGLWGWAFDIPSALICREGDILHSAFWLFFPSNFDSTATGAYLKFLRYTSHLVADLTGPGGTIDPNGISNGRSDHLIAAPEDFDTAPYVAHGQQQGFFLNCEYDLSASGVYMAPPVGSQATCFKTNRPIPRGAWALVESRVKWTSNAAQAEETLWVNRQFVVKRSNTTLSYINENGVLTNRTINAAKTLTSASYCIANLMMFTYWNSFSPQTQSVWLDKAAWAKNPASLPDMDEYGNAMMGIAI